MKNNWVFKIPKLDFFGNTNQKETIRLEQRKNFRAEIGDRALILQYIKGEWKFTAYYEIAEINSKNPDAETKIFDINLRLVNVLEDKLLDDYIYSLRRVTNFKSPIKHFRQRYNRISDTEFDGILYDNIYQKRTIVGTILNAMHRNHQESFLMYIAENSPSHLLSNADMDIVFSQLINYLNYSVIKPAMYLSASVEILNSLKIDTKNIGFSFDINSVAYRTAQMIQPQMEVINNYITQMPGFDNIKLEAQFLEDDDAKYKQLFRNTPLPITLN